MHMFSFSIGSMYRMVFYRANQGNEKSIPSDGSKEKPFLSSSSSQRMLAFICFQPHPPVSASVIVLHFHFLSTTVSHVVTLVIATWIIQDNLPFSRSLNWEHLQVHFLNKARLTILGITIWTSLGVYPTSVFLPPFLSFFCLFSLLYF